MLRTARRPKEQPSVYKMTYRAAKLGYTLVETFGPAPDFTPTYTIYSGWPNGNTVVKTFSKRIQVYNWLGKTENGVLVQ